VNRRTLSLLVAALFTLSGCGARHPVEDAAPTGLSPATPSQQADPTTLLTDPAQL
jgi:predicted small lipoprotein YifL